MEKKPNVVALLRRYQRFVDFDEQGQPLHPLFDERHAWGGHDNAYGAGARFKGHAVVIHQNKILLEHDTSRNVWKLPATTYTNTKNQALRLLDKRYPTSKGRVIYANMNNFDEHQTRHRWIEGIVKRYDAQDKERFRGQWFEKGALPENIQVFDGIILHQYVKWC